MTTETDIVPLKKLSPASLSRLREQLVKEHAGFKRLGLKLNIARGKPSADQLDLSNKLLSMSTPCDWISRSGDDTRNYGGDPKGLIELREIFAPIVSAPVAQVVAGGNSSLAMMHDVLTWALLKGVPGSSKPWIFQGEIAFLCPAPGYELHHNMCSEFGIQLWPVRVTPAGPDIDLIEHLVRDPRVKGMWCVPTYANPTGEVWSDALVDRLAAMETSAPDFRLFWDDAYVMHHLSETHTVAKPIIPATAAARHPDRAFVFTSTSKITFAAGGVGFFAASDVNVAWYIDRAKRRGPGPDKINQLRHARFLKDAESIARHMNAHRAIIAPKFAVILDALDKRLSGRGAAEWSRPTGGYFISIDTVPGAATRAVKLAAEAGVELTAAGSTWPEGYDPEDRNIRIAPSFATLEEVNVAAMVIALSVLLAAVERALRLN